MESYYKGLWSCSLSSDAPSSWHQHFRGIFTGCSISIILFLAAINIVLEYVRVKIVIPDKPSPPVKAFLDDFFLKTRSAENAQTLLNYANKCLTWARVKVKPAKSRC